MEEEIQKLKKEVGEIEPLKKQVEFLNKRIIELEGKIERGHELGEAVAQTMTITPEKKEKK
jgi:hypothetical protein